MARFLFVSTPIPAHTLNAMPLVSGLIATGHQVSWCAGSAFHPQISDLGAAPAGFRRSTDLTRYTSRRSGLRRPPRAGRGPVLDPPRVGFGAVASGPLTVGRTFARVFAGEAAARARDVGRLIEERSPDVVVTDLLAMGTGLAADLAGVPWASFGDGPSPFFDADTPPFGTGLPYRLGRSFRLRNAVVRQVVEHGVFGRAQAHLAAARAELGLPARAVPMMQANVSTQLHLQAGVPGLEYPNAAVPRQLRWIGALAPPPPSWTAPPTWAELTCGDRPVVFVSQGTIRDDPRELLLPALEGLAGLGVAIVAVSGRHAPDQLRRQLRRRPDHAMICPFVPYHQALDRATVFVTNGGWTGVTMALARGVPVVQVGRTEEKGDIGARVQYAGAGRCLSRPGRGGRRLRRAVEEVLTQSRYRTAAARLREEFSSYDAVRSGVRALAALAAGNQHPIGRPVGQQPNG